MRFGEAAQVEPAPPLPLTPESVHRILHDPATPEPLLRWTQEHLAVRGADGSFSPRSAPEIAATLARLEQEATQAVAARPDRTDPSGPLHILAFDGAGAMERLSVELGGLGDRVVLRVPDVPSTTLAPEVELRGADPLPGITGKLSPLLRTDGLPADVDVLLGYGDTAGIADVRRDAYPEATVVQLLDTVPTDPGQVAVLARADLVIAAGPEVARQLQVMFDRLGPDRPPPPVHEIPTGPGVSPAETARELHRAVAGLGEGVSRVADATWSRELSTREVVLRGAGEPAARGAPRVMTTFVAWSSEGGGGATANRELATTFAAVGAEVYARVPAIGAGTQGPVFTDPDSGVRVVGSNPVWGVVDANGQPDRRAFIMLLDNLPPDIDVVVGHSRFSGGAAAWLAEHVYPDA
ncbi:MAG: hypothetical protein ACRDT2_17115, partial [Natronosporangium sp.]